MTPTTRAWAACRAALRRWLPGTIVRAVGRLERRVGRLGPRVAVLVLFAPAIALLPVKLGALWLLGVGRVALGLGVLVLAKIVGTAIAGWLFLLTRPQLMRLGWFARGHARWSAWKGRLLEGLARSRAWLAVQAFGARWQARRRG